MMKNELREGQRVEVSHELGTETGTVIGITNPRPGERRQITVLFDDHTQSSWYETKVRAARSSS